MATEEYGIREPNPLLGGGDTLKSAHSLALVLSTSDWVQEEARDVAFEIARLLERSYDEFAARLPGKEA